MPLSDDQTTRAAQAEAADDLGKIPCFALARVNRKRIDPFAVDVAKQQPPSRRIPHRRLGDTATRVPGQFKLTHASAPRLHRIPTRWSGCGPLARNLPGSACCVRDGAVREIHGRESKQFSVIRQHWRGNCCLRSTTGAMTDHMTGRICCAWRGTRSKSPATSRSCDRAVLTAAIILHDCVAVEKNSPDRSRASRLAAVRAREILAVAGWAPARIDQAAHAIEAHSFSAGIAPATLEARIVQDADRLDAIGAIGIARCFYVAGRMGRGFTIPQIRRRRIGNWTTGCLH